MAIKRLQRSPSDGVEGNIADILNCLKEHPEIEELSCEETVSNDDVQAIDELLWQYHNGIHLSCLELPKNGLSKLSSPSLQRIVQTQCESLVRLDLSHNPLTCEGVVNVLQPLLDDCAVLRHLNLTGTQMGSKGASIIASLLQHNRTVEELNVSRNNFSTRGIKTLAPHIANNSTLRVLDLSHNALTARGASALAKALQKSRIWQLKELRISSNKIRTSGMDAFCDFLVLDRRLEALHCCSNEIKPEGAAYLAGVLKHNYTLRDLRISDNQFGDIGATLIVDQLAENSTLEHLDLSWNQLTPESAFALAEALPRNSTLESLVLTGNQLGCEGTMALTQALEFNLTLKEIDLTNNQIENQGAFALSLTLSKPTSSVERIHWKDNPISDEGVASLSRIPRIKRNYKSWLGDMLRAINKKESVNMNLTKKSIGDEEVLLLSSALAENQPTVRSLYLEGATISSRSLVPFAKAVLDSRLSKIERLYIRKTALGDAGAMAIAKALHQNTSLEVLMLSKCGISCKGAIALAQGLSCNTTLRRLNLDRNFIRTEGFVAVVTQIQPSLRALSANHNQLTDAIFATGALSNNENNLHVLSELHLNGNALSDRGLLQLCAHFMDKQSRKSLTLLSLRDNPDITERGVQTLQNWLGRDAEIYYQ